MSKRGGSTQVFKPTKMVWIIEIGLLLSFIGSTEECAIYPVWNIDFFCGAYNERVVNTLLATHQILYL